MPSLELDEIRMKFTLHENGKSSSYSYRWTIGADFILLCFFRRAFSKSYFPKEQTTEITEEAAECLKMIYKIFEKKREEQERIKILKTLKVLELCYLKNWEVLSEKLSTYILIEKLEIKE